MGGLQLIDYAMLKHAEGNWLSNYNGSNAKIDLRIRNMPGGGLLLYPQLH
jgi:alpha-galactosidase